MALGAISAGNAQQRAQERIICYDLRVRGLSLRAVGQEASRQLGYPISTTKVHELLNEETESLVRPKREAFIAWELDRLDKLAVRAWEVVERAHVTVSHGKVIRDDETGQKIQDDGPVLAAIDRLVKISESRRRLLGLDEPVKVDATVTETTQQDLELQELLREAAVKAAAEEARIKGTTSENVS